VLSEVYVLAYLPLGMVAIILGIVATGGGFAWPSMWAWA
jgi:hypothetical protein